MKKIGPILLVITIIALTGCRSFLKIPPIPEAPQTVEEELKHMYKTDQKDRRQVLFKVLFQTEEKYMTDPKVIAVSDRDSIRLSRVIFLDNEKAINSDLEKFYAAFIYLHQGGSKMTENSSYLQRSLELFKDVMQQAESKKLRKRAEIYFEEAQRQLNYLDETQTGI